VTAAPSREATPARRPRWLPFGLIVAVVVGLDQLTKAWLTASLAPFESMAVAGDWIRLVHGQNTGGLFGLLHDSAAALAGLSVAVAVGIVWYQSRAGASWYVTLALGLLLGGAIGNLVDRLRFGYVIDFVDVGIGDIRFWTFNVADASISGSILLLILAGIWPALASTGHAASDA
jgi:signal peptidase II